MIVVQNSIVSDDIADRRFGCDLGCCRGACCVDGDSGAPLLEEEVPVLEAILPEVKPYMTAEGLDAVERQGVAVRDNDGDLGTPLIAGGACAYITYDGDLSRKPSVPTIFNFQISIFNSPSPSPATSIPSASKTMASSPPSTTTVGTSAAPRRAMATRFTYI